MGETRAVSHGAEAKDHFHFQGDQAQNGKPHSNNFIKNEPHVWDAFRAISFAELCGFNPISLSPLPAIIHVVFICFD